MVNSIFHYTQPKIFISHFRFLNLCQQPYQNSGLFINSFLRFTKFKNNAIWLLKSILAYNSGTRIFPDMEFALANSLFRLNFHYKPKSRKNMKSKFFNLSQKSILTNCIKFWVAFFLYIYIFIF